MRLMPIVYVSSMERAFDFYTALGLKGDPATRRGVWAELAIGDTTLALHTSNPLPTSAGRMALAFVSHEPLESLVSRLKGAGLALEREITDETFGRSIQVRDPDGLIIQINEHDLELYN